MQQDAHIAAGQRAQADIHADIHIAAGSELLLEIGHGGVSDPRGVAALERGGGLKRDGAAGPIDAAAGVDQAAILESDILDTCATAWRVGVDVAVAVGPPLPTLTTSCGGKSPSREERSTPSSLSAASTKA
jgi:uncharacterized protein (DUF2345 family)